MAASTTTIAPPTSESAHSQHSKRRLSTKGSLDAAFRYEKSRPRARTMTTVLKGHHSPMSTPLSSKLHDGVGKVTVSAGGQRNLSILRGSATSVPAGPKSASSRVSLERARVPHVIGSKDRSAGHASRQSSTSSSSSVSCSDASNTAGHANKLANGHVEHQQKAGGPQPSSSTSANGAKQEGQLPHHSPSVDSALVDATKAAPPSSASSAPPRRIHIAPLRLVNSNAPAGRESFSHPLSRSHSTTTLPSSTNWTYSSASGSFSSSTTNGPVTGPPYQSSYPNQACRFEKPAPPIALSAHPSSFIPVNPIPTSAPSYQVQYAVQHQRNPSVTPPMSYQGGESVQVGLPSRRTSDFTVMQVVHPHYGYRPPLPASLASMSGGVAAMSPRASTGPSYQYSLSQTTPASWNGGGYAAGITLPPRTGAGWPSSSMMEQSPSNKAPYMSNSNARFIPPSSPIYRFPLASSPAWHVPPEQAYQHDSMRGSLKRKASLGLVDMRSASRRRSSEESSRGSRRGSRAGADKLPPVVSRPHGQSPNCSNET